MNVYLPINYELLNNLLYKKTHIVGDQWQVIDTSKGKALIVEQSLLDKWHEDKYIDKQYFANFEYNFKKYNILLSGDRFILEFLGKKIFGKYSYNDAISFAIAFARSRKVNKTIPLSNAIFIEKLSIILPTYEIDLEDISDDVLVGRWCTSGINISIFNTKRIGELTLWSEDEIGIIIKKSGLLSDTLKEEDKSDIRTAIVSEQFKLAGRPDLEKFFNEHIIDFIKNQERYRKLGVSFPGAIILYGPPGSGKTFAVNKLIDYLKWPNYRIEASSVASPYIHETSKKIAEVFEEAMKNAPSVLVIDEMEAFLSERESTSGKHTVEEVAEFLRRIPEATENEVLLIGMTNKINMIDPAILRRGRFDHIVKVDYATKEEIREIIDAAFSNIPIEDDILIDMFISKLKDRPISDIAFWIKESARIAALNAKEKIDKESMIDALSRLQIVSNEDQTTEKKVGFIKD